MNHWNKMLSHLLFFLVLYPADWLHAVDHGGPYRPYSKELQIDQIELTGLDEADFSVMSLDDVRLKNAYILVFTSSIGGNFGSKRPEIVGALADMRKRGEAVSPLLLELMKENQETLFETMVLSSVKSLGTISLDPYLDYARKVLRDRTHSMSAVLAGSSSNILAENGNKEDAELMKWVMEQRPWLADSVTRKLDQLNRRLALPQQEPRPALRGKTAGNDPPKGEPRNIDQKTPIVIAEKEQDSTRWIKWFLAILVLCGLFRLLLKMRK